MTLLDLRNRTWKRLDDDGTYWKQAELDAALNLAQRAFCLLTLSIEQRAILPLEPAVRFYLLSTPLPQYLVMLRVYLEAITPGSAPGGSLWDVPLWDVPLWDEPDTTVTAAAGFSKLHPARLEAFDAANPPWPSTAGTPTRYAPLGVHLLAIDQAPSVAQTQRLHLTFAVAPHALVSDGDTPAIREEYHPALIDFARWWLRLKEGGQQLTQAAPGLGAFLSAAAACSARVRARASALGYDTRPYELTPAAIAKLVERLGKK